MKQTLTLRTLQPIPLTLEKNVTLDTFATLVMTFNEMLLTKTEILKHNKYNNNSV